ncbi:unnamed protein product, partial [Mesorhabditis spiculigera]
MVRALPLVALLLVGACQAATTWNSTHTDYENWKICLTRDIQVGDVLMMKGKLVPNANRWTCNIEMESRNGVWIHADHRIVAKNTVYNSKYPGQKYPKEMNFPNKIPYKGGDEFEIHFTIQSKKSTLVSYGAGAKWGGALFTHSTSIPNPGLENMRMIRCDGDMKEVMFRGGPVGLCAGQSPPAPAPTPAQKPTDAPTTVTDAATTTLHTVTIPNRNDGNTTDVTTTTPANGGTTEHPVFPNQTPDSSPAPAPCSGYQCMGKK